MGSFFQFSIVKIGTLCFLPSPLCGEMGGRGLKHCKTQYFWHLDFRRGFPGAQEAQAASQLLPVWVHYLGSMLPLGVCSTTLGSMFNYHGEYFLLPFEVFSSILRSTFNYPGEYVQLPWGVCSTTLGSIFNYPGDYVQLPWGVCSPPSGVCYPWEYVQLPWGV